jgi:hypothetical protein
MAVSIIFLLVAAEASAGRIRGRSLRSVAGNLSGVHLRIATVSERRYTDMEDPVTVDWALS